MAARPIEPAAHGTAAQRSSGGTRGGRHLGRGLGRRRVERRIVDETARERRAQPVDIERGLQFPRLARGVAGGKPHDRHGCRFGSRCQPEVARQEHPILYGAACEEIGVGRAVLGDRRIVAGRPQPTAEPQEHLVTQQAHHCHSAVGQLSAEATHIMFMAMPALPRAILFDLDDTILAAFGQSPDQWRRVIGEYAPHLDGHAPDAVIDAIQAYSRYLWADQARHKDWRHRIGDARRHIVASAFAAMATGGGPAPPPLDISHAIADRFNAVHEAELRMFPGAHETLDRLKELGVRLALITNGAAAPQRRKVVRFALERRFDHIQIEGEHGFGKPEAQAYLHAMAALGVAAGDTWMVGDNLEWEVVAPQRLGIYAIWHDGYGTGLPPGSPIRPDRIIRSLPELLE